LRAATERFLNVGRFSGPVRLRDVGDTTIVSIASISQGVFAMTIDRRTLLASTGAAATASLLPRLAFAETQESNSKDGLPIVDTHQHLWDLDKLDLPWLSKESPLRRNFVTSDYLEATKGLNVVKAVYMEVDVAEEQKVKEAEHVIELSRSDEHPTVAAVIGCRLASPEFGDYARRFRNTKEVKGFRQVLPSGKFSPQMVKNLQLLGELGKSYDLCLPAAELKETVKVVDACPETRFILDHCGNADVKAFVPVSRRGDQKPGHDVDAWKRNIAALAERKHVICKISGIIASVPKEWSSDDLAPIVNHCLDSFGPDRVVFGSDWPVCLNGAPLKAWVGALKEIIVSRPLEEQRKLLSDNATAFYRLE
jgi:L-fuconolactonase